MRLCLKRQNHMHFQQCTTNNAEWYNAITEMQHKSQISLFVKLVYLPEHLQWSKYCSQEVSRDKSRVLQGVWDCPCKSKHKVFYYCKVVVGLRNQNNKSLDIVRRSCLELLILSDLMPYYYTIRLSLMQYFKMKAHFTVHFQNIYNL